jgi:thioredoxin 1
LATIELNQANFNETVAKDGIVIVDCWAEWCGPCKMFGPVFEETSNKYTQHVFAKLDTEANRDLAGALQIQSIPTVMVFRDGVLLFRQPGAIPGNALEDLISKVEALDMAEIKKQIAEEEAKSQQQ